MRLKRHFEKPDSYSNALLAAAANYQPELDPTKTGPKFKAHRPDSSWRKLQKPAGPIIAEQTAGRVRHASVISPRVHILYPSAGMVLITRSCWCIFKSLIPMVLSFYHINANYITHNSSSGTCMRCCLVFITEMSALNYI